MIHDRHDIFTFFCLAFQCISLVVCLLIFSAWNSLLNIVHWPLPNFQFLFLFFLLARKNKKIKSYMCLNIYVYISAYFFCCWYTYLFSFNHLLRKQLRSRRGGNQIGGLTGGTGGSGQCSRKWPSTWFLIKFSSMNWNCQRLVAIVADFFVCFNLMFLFLF